MSTAQTCASMSAHGIYLVDKDDAGAMFLTLVKKVTYPCCSHSYKHFHKVGATDAEEGHARLAGNCLSQQGFTRSGTSHQEHASGDASTQSLELLGLLQKLHNLLQFFLGFIHSGHIFEGDIGLTGHM